MRVETDSGTSAYIRDDGNVEGNEFTTKPLGL
jgi:hypothetical protein